MTALFADLFPLSPPSPLPPTQKQQQSGVFVPEKSNIWRDCVDGYYDWVKEHIAEVRRERTRERERKRGREGGFVFGKRRRKKNEEEKTKRSTSLHLSLRSHKQGAPINEADHCGDPPMVLAAGNGEKRRLEGKKEKRAASVFFFLFLFRAKKERDEILIFLPLSLFSFLETSKQHPPTPQRRQATSPSSGSCSRKARTSTSATW